MIRVEIKAASNGFIVSYGESVLVFSNLEEALRAVALAVYPEEFRPAHEIQWVKDD